MTHTRHVMIVVIFLVLLSSCTSSKLISAINNGDLQAVKSLAAKDESILSKSLDRNKIHPLHQSIAKGQFDIVKYLVSEGADVNIKNKKGGTPAYYATTYHHTEMLKYLVSKGADVNSADLEGIAPLHLAVYFGELDTVKYLISHGARINIQNNAGATPALYAVVHHHSEILKYLVSQGADVNISELEGIAPLHQAVINGELDTVKYLVTHGARINIQNNAGATPALYAVVHHHPKILKYFVSQGADVNIASLAGHTPLNQAIYNSNLGIVQYLVSHGANINVKNKIGHTPLHYAVDHGQASIIEYLISKGADKNIRDNQGYTPRQFAFARNKPKMAQYFSITTINSNSITKFTSMLKEASEKLKHDLKSFKKKEQKHKERELVFINDLDDDQLKLYSDFIDNYNGSDNVAKTLLSFRQLIRTLNEKQENLYVKLFNEKRNLKEKRASLDERKMNLAERKRIIDDMNKAVAVAEAQSKDKTTYVLQQQAQQDTGDSLLMQSLEKLSDHYSRKAEMHRKSAERLNRDYQNQQVIDSLRGIEGAIRGY